MNQFTIFTSILITMGVCAGLVDIITNAESSYVSYGNNQQQPTRTNNNQQQPIFSNVPFPEEFFHNYFNRNAKSMNEASENATSIAAPTPEESVKPRNLIEYQINIFDNNIDAPINIGYASNRKARKTTPSNSLPWWKTSIIYQIYPRSFKDSSGSGIGDLKGIISKADYLKDLGIGAVWLSPIYVSPMDDFGYDIANYTDVDPLFGNMKDFDELVRTLHSRGIKIIMDFIPNHSSDQHEWFKKSVQKIEPYSNYYVWQKPDGFNISGDPIPPNNWLSFFGHSAWKWSKERGEFYLHQFLDRQPDLNVRNPKVMAELDKILKFWLDKGVDGFRVDALKFLFEDEDLTLNEMPNSYFAEPKDPNEYDFLNHTYSVNQPETVDAVRRWRNILDTYDDRMLMVEVYDENPQQVLKYYDRAGDKVSHFPFNFFLITELKNRNDVTGVKLKDILDIWLENTDAEQWSNWVLGNHDRGRVASRLGKELVDSLNMLILLLPGTPTTYYGEEIGMEDTPVTFKQAQDPFGKNFGKVRFKEFGRDPPRSPMQWSDGKNAGFSPAKSTWLPLNDNYADLNVRKQENDKYSHLKVYKKLASLRQMDTFIHGNLSFPIITSNIFAFMREYENSSSYLTIINTARNRQFLRNYWFREEKTGVIEVKSSSDPRTITTTGNFIDISDISLLGGEGIVLRIVE